MPPAPQTPTTPFFVALTQELESRARMLLAGQRRTREGQLTVDDLVQETLAKLLSSYDEKSLRERPHNQLMALAWRTMKNLVIDASRRKMALLEDARPETDAARPVAARTPDDGPTPDASLEVAGRHRAVANELAKLSPEERCFLSTVLETDSVPAAQKHCGWPPKSPYYVLKKLLEKLRGELSEWAPG